MSAEMGGVTKMNVVYPARWHSAGPNRDEACALASVVALLERDLRAAGFELAADLAAAAEFAVWQQIANEPAASATISRE